MTTEELVVALRHEADVGPQVKTPLLLAAAVEIEGLTIRLSDGKTRERELFETLKDRYEEIDWLRGICERMADISHFSINYSPK